MSIKRHGVMRTKSISIPKFKVLDEAKGIAEMYVSVFGVVDSYGDRIVKGAFEESLARRTPVGLYGHTTPVARTIIAKEVPAGSSSLPAKIKKYGGLYVKAQYNLETENGRTAFSDLKSGVIKEFSIGYQVIEDKRNTKDKCTELRKIDLFEWSSVIAGANPLTQVINVKQRRMKKSEHEEQMAEVADHAQQIIDICSAMAEDEEPDEEQMAEVADHAQQIIDICSAMIGGEEPEDEKEEDEEEEKEDKKSFRPRRFKSRPFKRRKEVLDFQKIAERV